MTVPVTGLALDVAALPASAIRGDTITWQIMDTLGHTDIKHAEPDTKPANQEGPAGESLANVAVLHQAKSRLANQPRTAF